MQSFSTVAPKRGKGGGGGGGVGGGAGIGGACGLGVFFFLFAFCSRRTACAQIPPGCTPRLQWDLVVDTKFDSSNHGLC
jgi:hypothetical protein